MNLLVLKPRTKQSISITELIEYLKQAKTKTASVSLSNDLKSLQIELKVNQ